VNLKQVKTLDIEKANKVLHTNNSRCYSTTD